MEPSKDGDWVWWEDGFGSPLTLEEVIAETRAFFDAGHGNPALRDPMITHMENKKEVPHAVLVSLGFKRITAYQRTKLANGE